MEQKGFYPVTFYFPPNGRTKEVIIENIYQADVDFFENENVSISMEETGGFYVVYLNHPDLVYEGEPDEVIVLVQTNEKCEDAIRRGRKELESILDKL